MEMERETLQKGKHSILKDLKREVGFANKKIFFKVGNVFKSVYFNDILFFEADRNIIYAHTRSRNYATSLQLKVLMRELYPQFLRVHKSHLVNVEHIMEISPRTYKLRMSNGWTLPIGKTYKKSVFENLGITKARD